jgi:CheY-like chemotaxis protein
VEQQESLFRPFAQADSSTARKFGGTGLGHSISRALVELMGGAISVRGKPGRGSIFSFYIELESAGNAQTERTGIDQALEDQRYDGKCILLVEDNAINQEIAVAVLSELGLAVDLAENGEEGVRAFLKKDYDLIFMDIQMPVMDGFEASRQIRALEAKRFESPEPGSNLGFAQTPIIAMTANAMREDREACIAAGMNGHISKPLDLSEIKRALFQYLRG